jgi:hypothetical protein
MRSRHYKSIDTPEPELQEELNRIKKEDSSLAISPELENRLLQAMRAPSQSKPLQSNYWMKAAAVFLIVLIGGAIWMLQPEPRHNFRPEINRPGDDALTGYLPLTYGLTPDESLQRVRVKLPRSALDQFGIRVDNNLRTEEVTADLLVGESGLPYAVRVIHKN